MSELAKDVILSIFMGYLFISFICFSIFFLFLYDHGKREAAKEKVKRYSYADHFWLCVGFALSWPYGLKVLMSKDE